MRRIQTSHRHTGSLLHMHVFAALHQGRREHEIVYGLAAAVFQLHLIREIHGRSRRAGIGQNFSGLHIIRTELSGTGKIALHVGYIIIVPEAADLRFLRLHLYLSVFHEENVRSHLFHAYHKIIGHGIPSVEGQPVIRHIRRLRIRPLIVCLCHSSNTLCSGQITETGAGGFRKGIPVGFVEHHDFRGFSHRKQIQCTVTIKISLLYVAIHIFGQLLLGEIFREIHQLILMLHGIGRIRIGGKEVRQRLGTHLACGSFRQRLLQV